MSQATEVLDKSLIAGTDLRTKQYYIVRLAQPATTPYGVELGSSSIHVALGVLQNDPNMSETAVIRMEGTTKMVVKAAVRTGSPISVASDGIGSPTGEKIGAGSFVIGIALEDASSNGDIIEVLLTHFLK